MKTKEQIEEHIRIAEACNEVYEDEGNGVFVYDMDYEQVETLSYYAGIRDALRWLDNDYHLLGEDDINDCKRTVGIMEDEEEEEEEWEANAPEELAKKPLE